MTAAKALKEIITNFHTSQVKEMNDFANTLANWKQEILNYFELVQTGEDFIIDDDLNNAETELIKNFIAKNRPEKDETHEQLAYRAKKFNYTKPKKMC